MGDVSKSNVFRPSPNTHDLYELRLSRGAETLSCMEGRFQLPDQAKFNRPDPQRDWNWLAPHTINLYEYVGNDPVNKWDPTGYLQYDEKLKKNHPRLAAFFDSAGERYASKSAEFKKAFKKYSQLSDEQISTILTPGAGPIIGVKDL